MDLSTFLICMSIIVVAEVVRVLDNNWNDSMNTFQNTEKALI
jgi:hypothetical protein